MAWESLLVYTVSKSSYAYELLLDTAFPSLKPKVGFYWRQYSVDEETCVFCIFSLTYGRALECWERGDNQLWHRGTSQHCDRLLVAVERGKTSFMNALEHWSRHPEGIMLICSLGLGEVTHLGSSWR